MSETIKFAFNSWDKSLPIVVFSDPDKPIISKQRNELFIIINILLKRTSKNLNSYEKLLSYVNINIENIH